jgi:hypothetical protein
VLDSHSTLLGRLLLHSNVSRGSGIGTELKDDEMGLVESDVGGLEVTNGLGYVLTDRPIISVFLGIR